MYDHSKEEEEMVDTMVWRAKCQGVRSGKEGIGLNPDLERIEEGSLLE